MADRILIDPDNRLLGSFSSDFAMFGGQVDPVIAARLSEAAEAQDEARESLPAAASGTPGQSPEFGAASAQTAPLLATDVSPSIAPALTGPLAPVVLDTALPPTRSAEQADADALAASRPAAPAPPQVAPEAPPIDDGVATSPGGGAAEPVAAAEPGAPPAAASVDPIRVEMIEPIVPPLSDAAVVTSGLPIPEAEAPAATLLPIALAALTIQPDLAGLSSEADEPANLVTTTLPELIPSLAGLDVANAPDALVGQSAALTAFVDPLASSLPAGAPLSDLVTVPTPQAFPLSGPAEVAGASLDSLATAPPLPSLPPIAEIASATIAAPGPPAAPVELIAAAAETAATPPVPLPPPPVVEVASAPAAPASSVTEPVTAPTTAPAPAPPVADDDLSDLGGSDPAGGITTLVGMVSSGQILDAPEAGEDAGAPSAPADPLLDELTKGAADEEEADTRIVTAPDPAPDDFDLPGGL